MSLPKKHLRGRLHCARLPCIASEVILLWSYFYLCTAAWLAHLGERRSAEREVVGSNPGRTNT